MRGVTVPGYEPDGWLPSVQGAVGHVQGVRGPDGTPYVLKTYADDERRRTEAFFLPLAGREVPAPELVRDGPGWLLMTRLDGVRAADRQGEPGGPGGSGGPGGPVAREAGALLRGLHRLRGIGHGLWAYTTSRAGLEEFTASGGSAAVADRLAQRLADARPDFAGAGPALCHRDAITSNLLVPATGPVRLTGVVDFERAGWDDPMADLAQSHLHFAQHDPADGELLLAGYGELSPAQRRRLDLHELLHAARERTWVAHDRPANEVEALARLDALLAERA